MLTLSRSPSILLAEDNILNQKLIYLNLKKFGFEIDIANNGQEALDKVKLKNYDLVLMDVMMPIMGGLEACKHIREYEMGQNRYTIIIGLTANTFDSDRDKCLAYGMDEYMTKPFDIKVFSSIVHDLQLFD